MADGNKQYRFPVESSESRLWLEKNNEYLCLCCKKWPLSVTRVTKTMAMSLVLAGFKKTYRKITFKHVIVILHCTVMLHLRGFALYEVL